MAKYYGKIGFAMSVELDPENEPGVFVDQVIEREYYGDTVRQSYRFEHSGNVNDNINVNCQFSILSDDFATENCQYIKYIEYMNSKWKVTSVDANYPRLNLTVGGIYNG